MILIILAFLTSLIISFAAIPSIIKIAEIKHLFDEPDHRKTHASRTPTLGGIAIFAALVFSLTFWSTQTEIIELQYIICSIILLFFMGIKDDLFNLVAYKKLLGQLIASFILVHFAGIKITTFYGLFGIDDLQLLPSYILSIFTIVVITNSLNLIDGIDGLAALVGIIGSLCFGGWFLSAGVTQYAILASCMCGALIGFFHFNKSPSKIFMGDTGSLIVGVVLSILAIKFIEMNRVLDRTHPNKVLAVPIVTFGILVIPLFDTLRVFTLRILQGRSPLSADRNHIHHLLLQLGFSHMRATLSLGFFNLLIIAAMYYFQFLRGEILLATLLSICVLASSYLAHRVRKKTIGMVSQSFGAPSGSRDSIHDDHLQ
jgi:UDP-GlcNAc:undecaprenyl-phosphate GlcNAc-1-phosphate transferase